jgi:hypothetical protein
MPSTILCTITNVRRSALHGGAVADVTGSTTETKLRFPTQKMHLNTILAARGTLTGRSWAFLGFRVPSCGEQILNDQLCTLLACQQQLTSKEYSSCQHEVPTRESWMRFGYRYYRLTCNLIMLSTPTLRPCPLTQASCWSGNIIPPLP